MKDTSCWCGILRTSPLEGEEVKRVIGRLNTFSEGLGVEITEDGTLVPEE